MKEVPEFMKDIIFDVGDVLLGYRWEDMLMIDRGLDKDYMEHLGNLIFIDDLWRQYDLGNISDDDLIAEYGRKYPEEAEDIKWFIKHSELMPVPREDVWELVHQLKENGHEIYLLSNYSESLFNVHTKGAAFLEDIDGRVVSYEVHMAKPDHAIYKYLLNKYNLNAGNCIFYDDREDNTKAAREVGIESVTIKSREQLIELINDILLQDKKMKSVAI